MNFCYWKYFQFLLYILIWFPSIVTSQPNFYKSSCMESSGNYSKNSLYETNLKALLNSLPSGMDNYGFNSSSFGPTPNTVYAISLCRGDVQIDACRDCVRDAISALPQICPNSKEAIGWYGNCMLWYSNKSIGGKLQSSPTFYDSSAFNASSKDQFNEASETLLSGLRKSASNSGVHKKFATNHTIGPDNLTIYGLMQCIPDLSIQDCDSCLSTSEPDSVNHALSSSCNGKIGCKVVKPSCSMEYEVSQFYSDTSAPPPSNSSTSMDESSNILDISSVDSLQFDFEIVSDATNDFSQTNKLGEGGFGAVYRGKMTMQLKQQSSSSLHQFLVSG